MKTISLALDETIFEETENILSKSKKPRNRYINEALRFYNQMQKKILLEIALRNESTLVQKSSMEVLKEFEAIEL
ncbi:hypothetical protein FACS1894162_7520 [Bacteroidia bacterium]|nr:hypothetical protein FACS1894162_7520 [Bacteroidia bacterium]